MKWFYMVMSFVVKRFAGGAGMHQSPVEELKELAAENAVKIFLAVAVAVILGAMFMGGVAITLVNLADQYDRLQTARLNTVTTVGLGLLALSLLGFLIGIMFSTRHNREHKRLEAQRAKHHHQLGSFQDAILLLVNDFIAEREFRREQRYSEMHHAHRTPSEDHTRH